MDEVKYSDAREKVLDVAEHLFIQKGYAAVTLRDIANALNIKHASLYYHVKSKEELFLEIMDRSLQRHHKGLVKVIENENLSWEGRLHAVSHWLLSQPSMNVSRIIQSDMPEISEAHAAQLMANIYRSVLMPLEQIFNQAQRETKRQLPHAGLLVGAFLSLIEGIQNAPPNEKFFKKDEAAEQIIDVMIRGLKS